MPTVKFVSQPLPITRGRIVTDKAAPQIAEVRIEARVPGSFPLDTIHIQISNFGDRRTKTGGADHGAVRAGKTTLADLFPAGMIQIAQKQSRQVAGFHVLCDLVDRLLSGGFR